MRCGYCGKIIVDGSKFCAHCGQPVSGRPAEQQKSRDPGFVSGGFFESDDFNFDEDGMEPDRSAGRSSDMADRTMSLDDISKILRERSREYEQEYPSAARITDPTVMISAWAVSTSVSAARNLVPGR